MGSLYVPLSRNDCRMGTQQSVERNRGVPWNNTTLKDKAAFSLSYA